MEIRRYRPADRSECYDIAVKTGAGGQDATGVYPDDDLIPEIFCGPYLDLEPGLAFVVDNGERVVGYVLAAADTRAFVARYRAEVLPAFSRRFSDMDGWSKDAREMGELGLHPERMLIPDLEKYPAHLHIDLLPEAQGQGLGRLLIARLLDELAALEVPGVYLDMDAANVGAGAFYERVGFTRIPSEDAGTTRFVVRLPHDALNQQR